MVLQGEPSQPSFLRNQLLRAAKETQDSTTADTDVEHEDADLAVRQPTTPPGPPPEQPAQDHTSKAEVMQCLDTLQRAILDSKLKLESLLQTASTLLATPHEGSAALLSSCKQQLDVIESRLRQDHGLVLSTSPG